MFYNKLNGKEKNEKSDIYQIKKEIEGKTYLITKPSEVIKKVGDFWKEMFTAKDIDKSLETLA